MPFLALNHKFFLGTGNIKQNGLLLFFYSHSIKKWCVVGKHFSNKNILYGYFICWADQSGKRWRFCESNAILVQTNALHIWIADASHFSRRLTHTRKKPNNNNKNQNTQENRISNEFWYEMKSTIFSGFRSFI